MSNISLLSMSIINTLIHRLNSYTRPVFVRSFAASFVVSVHILSIYLVVIIVRIQAINAVNI